MSKRSSPAKTVMMSAIVPVTATSDGTTLPSLTPQYNNVPRRYEDTKPVFVQDFTHRKILDIGNLIHKNTLEKADMEKQHAIRQAEEALWRQAEYMKEDAVMKERFRAEQEQDKLLKKINKQHEKSLKQEALRVESQMQKLMREEVQKEHELGGERQKAAVARAEDRCHQELLAAVSAARQEEKQLAEEEANKVAKMEAEKLVNALQKAENERQTSLKNQSDKLTQEKKEAVFAAHKEEQEITEQKLSEMKSMYKAELDKLGKQIDSRNERVEKLTNDLGQSDAERMMAENSLTDLQQEFQKFINKTYTEGQADYLLPQFDVVIGKGGMSMSRAESRM